MSKQQIMEELASAVAESIYRDAERYRWLRDKSNSAPDNTPTIYSDRKDGRILYGLGLDAAVDVAMHDDARRRARK